MNTVATIRRKQEITKEIFPNNLYVQPVMLGRSLSIFLLFSVWSSPLVLILPPTLPSCLSSSELRRVIVVL